MMLTQHAPELEQMKRWLLILALSAAAALFAAYQIGIFPAETFTERLSTRAPLIPGFESYATHAEVMNKLPPQFRTKIHEDSALRAGDTRPPYSIYSVGYPGFSYCDQSGELVLTFFNDRLEQTTFYPSDAKACLAAMATEGLDLINGIRTTRGDTTIWTEVDVSDRRYITWIDQRLLDQSDRWIWRYS
jgi:hypothetical protein